MKPHKQSLKLREEMSYWKTDRCFTVVSPTMWLLPDVPLDAINPSDSTERATGPYSPIPPCNAPPPNFLNLYPNTGPLYSALGSAPLWPVPVFINYTLLSLVRMKLI